MALKDLVIDTAEATAMKIAAKYPLWPHEAASLTKEIAEAIRAARANR